MVPTTATLMLLKAAYIALLEDMKNQEHRERYRTNCQCDGCLIRCQIEDSFDTMVGVPPQLFEPPA